MARTTLSVACALALAAGVLTLTACGDDDGEGGRAQTLSVTLTAANKLQGVAPPVESGPVTIRFTNRSRQPYDLQLIRVDGVQSIQAVLRVIEREGGPIPPWMHGAGGVGTVAPGQTSSSTQLLDGGNYYVIAGPDEENGRPVSVPLRIEGGKASGDLPQSTGKITAFDYGFRAQGLRAGRQEVEFDNTGAELHHVIAFPLRPGATIAQLRQALQREGPPPRGQQPPFEERGITGTAVLDGRQKQVAQLNLRRGKYGLVCFIQDRRGGPPHIAKGMITEVTVS